MRDYPRKFSKGLMKRKNVPLYEEGGEVYEPTEKQDYTLEFPDRPTSFGDSSKEEGEDAGKGGTKDSATYQQVGDMPDINWQRGTPMTQQPRNVTGDMPVAPDTRELQATDYEGRVHMELAKRRRDKDVEGSFKQRPFPADNPKLTEI